ncbi:MAG: pyruvate kinase [Candidatus Woesebacteria bacterium]|jgi:pyruvate kinase
MTKLKNLQKFTKIVATIGPATETEEILEELIKAGMNVARFNTKHGTPEWHHERITRVRKVAKRMRVNIAVLLDLQGPEIRIDLPDEGSFDIKKGQKAFFTYNKNLEKNNLVFIPKNVIETLQVGHVVLMDDGICEFKIVDKSKDCLVAKAINDFTVKHRKTLNTPGVVIDMPSLIKNDYLQLDAVVEDNVDYVGLSFVRDKSDIKKLRKELTKRKINAGIISKIENQAALDNIDEIIADSEGIMVARGDLAVEVPFEQLSYWQKLIIEKCRQASKPVITATQMLESMIDNPRPTRAEVSDVANAVYDKTDAVMLSGETTLGKYPVRCVETQAKIAQFNEKYTEPELMDLDEEDDIEATIAETASFLANMAIQTVDAIVVLSETGATAARILRTRPSIPVHLVTSNYKTSQKMTLYYNVTPHIVNWTTFNIKNAHEIVNKLHRCDWIKARQKVLVIHGTKWKKPGGTNTLSIVQT